MYYNRFKTKLYQNRQSPLNYVFIMPCDTQRAHTHSSFLELEQLDGFELSSSSSTQHHPSVLTVLIFYITGYKQHRISNAIQ